MKLLQKLFPMFRPKALSPLPTTDPEICPDPDALEVFINEKRDKYAELYCRNGIFTYMIHEKCVDDYYGPQYYYWCPAATPASFFGSREVAVQEIRSILGSINETDCREKV